jgi:FixJ family two-component response regulator
LIQGFVAARIAWGRDHVLWRFDLQLPQQPATRVQSSSCEFWRPKTAARLDHELRTISTRDGDPAGDGSPLARIPLTQIAARVSNGSWRRGGLRQWHRLDRYNAKPDGGKAKGVEDPLPGLVHVIDDDASFRTAMERRLKRAGYEVATYASAQHMLEQLPGESVRSCILLDVQIPGMDGPALQCRLNELGSTLPIIFLAGHLDIPTTVRTIKAGADDFLIKPVGSDKLLQAIELAMVSHEVRRGLKSRLEMACARVSALTPREREVFELVVRGGSNKQVARSLGCTERTIKAHRHSVMEKTRAETLAELVLLAERIGVLRAASANLLTASACSTRPVASRAWRGAESVG